ncbi:hypothetical protein [Kamptonema sp. UHCC 0994]|nr:hypothetical protein [Kamptonema sp. UHCC 0994]MDF0552788.1 hypothetical protein [Kamptonema sp. UHCC 0994]
MSSQSAALKDVLAWLCGRDINREGDRLSRGLDRKAAFGAKAWFCVTL